MKKYKENDDIIKILEKAIEDWSSPRAKMHDYASGNLSTSEILQKAQKEIEFLRKKHDTSTRRILKSDKQ